MITRSLINKLLFPDSAILWMPFAILKSLQICRKNKVDIILATGNPFSLFLSAYIISKFTHIPYVLDFRDPWTQCEYYIKSSLLAKVEKWLERKVVEGSSKVVSTTSIITEDFIDCYTYLDSSKFITIYNGYDYDDYGLAPFIRNDNRVIITHTGSIFKSGGGKNPESFLLAVKRLLEIHPHVKNLIQIIFVGLIDVRWKEMVKAMDISDIIKIKGHLSRKKSIRLMKSSDILLIISAQRVVTAQKLFEYQATEKPILAITPTEGACARIIKETNSGIVVPPDDIQKISDTLYKLICDVRSGIQIRPNKKNILKYQRSILTKQLAETFNQVVGKN